MTEQVEELKNTLEEKLKNLKQIRQYKRLKERLDYINGMQLSDLTNIKNEELQSLILESKQLTGQIKENEKSLENEENIKREINDCKEKLQKLKIEIDQEINDINDRIINNENNENNDDLIKTSEEYIKYYEDCLEKKSNNMNKNLEEKIKECIETLKEISDLSKDENKKTNNELEELRERKKTYEETLNLINRTLQDSAIKETMMEKIEELGMELQIEEKTEEPIIEQKPQAEPIIEKNDKILEKLKNESEITKNQELSINYIGDPESQIKFDEPQKFAGLKDENIDNKPNEEITEIDRLKEFFKMPSEMPLNDIGSVLTTASLEEEYEKLIREQAIELEDQTNSTIQDTKKDTFDLKEKYSLENYGAISKKIKDFTRNNMQEEYKMQSIHSILEKSENIFDFIKKIKEEKHNDIYNELKLDDVETQIKKIESLLEKIDNMKTNMSNTVIEKVKKYKDSFTVGFNKWLSNPECIIYLQYIYMCLNEKITNCPKYKLIDYDLKKIEREVIDIIKQMKILPLNDNAWKLFATDVSEKINEINDTKPKRSLK